MKFLIICTLLLMSVYVSPFPYNPNQQGSGDNDYMFKYFVKEQPVGNNFGHREMRIGNQVTGMYYVLLPDGRVQKVDYVADENGYRPTVTYLNP
ncbi:pro-resilin [Pieris rapae]|uniref:pro-resilin n=1 Tax=Pieris rapae TaxID=64459 RepID=UPI001E27C605|nr:pro-resilin [Pieris rapae]